MDIPTDTCEHVLTNHTTKLTAATGFCLGDEAASKLRQTKYGYRGDAHIGEASHPGPKNISLTDDKPDVEAGWWGNGCAARNHELLKSCEMCGRVKKPRRTETGVGDAARTHKQIQNADNLFEAIAASCTQFEQDYGEPVPAPPKQQLSIGMPELEPVITPVAPPANVSAGAAPAEMEEICLSVPAEKDLLFTGFSVK